MERRERKSSYVWRSVRSTGERRWAKLVGGAGGRSSTRGERCNESNSLDISGCVPIAGVEGAVDPLVAVSGSSDDMFCITFFNSASCS